jgi:HPt (histidine-containing phosphotransfer) domain-containing protein
MSKIDELWELDPDGGLLRELLNVFFTTFEARRRELEEAIARGDRARVRAIGHELRSSCGNLGAEVLAELARELEHSPTFPGSDLLARLDREFTTVRDLLETARP